MKSNFKYNYHFNEEEAKKVFFTSDLHFNHENIIRYCNRPFKNAEEMNLTMIKNWNNKVPEDGVIFIIGDFAWGNDSDAQKIINNLNGRKILILGNHDYKHLKSGWMKSFEFVTQQMYIKVANQKIFLNHFPFLCYSGPYKTPPIWQLFGHVHSNNNHCEGIDNDRLQYLYSTQYDVGVDNNEFAPISFYELQKKIGK